ncbi:MAG: hypothetical protein ACYC36_12800 [Bellilinea sp.]
MEALSKILFKELNPVTVYLGDLSWVEEYLGAINEVVDLTYIDSDNEPRYITGVKNLAKDDSIVGLTKLDNLEINSYDYHVWFHKNKTIVKFTKVTTLTTKIFEDICNRLEKRQRIRKNLKQQIFLYHKHIKKGNFLTQDKVPLWLTVLMFFLGGVVTKFAELLIDVLLKKPS